MAATPPDTKARYAGFFFFSIASSRAPRANDVENG